MAQKLNLDVYRSERYRCAINVTAPDGADLDEVMRAVESHFENSDLTNLLDWCEDEDDYEIQETRNEVEKGDLIDLSLVRGDGKVVVVAK